MTITYIIIIGIMTLTLVAPFISLYAVSLVKKKNYPGHINVQKRLFWICIAALAIFEVRIRMSGGSGSLVADSGYVDTSFFKILLISHIVGAVLTYIIWAITVFTSNRKWKIRKTLPGTFSLSHKRLGYVTIVGLFYTAVTALLVCIFAFVL